MRGFIETPLLLILALLGPMLADLNQELRLKLNLLAKSKILSEQLQQAESDLNYFILNEKNFGYEAKFTPTETQLEGADFILRTFEIKNKATKILAQTNKQRLFNWSKAFRELEISKNCEYNLLELKDYKLFDCNELTINQLITNSSVLIASSGKMNIGAVQITGTNSKVELIAYEALKINQIIAEVKKNSSLLIFSQIGEVLIDNAPPKCSDLAWEISSRDKIAQCFPLIKTGAYWPQIRIISANCHDCNY